ncbi:MAG: SufD family Fe-S cluster assembly protein [Pseudomonadales bacterium]
MAERLTLGELAAALPLPDGAQPVKQRALAALDSGLFRELWKYTPATAFVSGLEGVEVSRPALSGFDQAGVTVRQLRESDQPIPEQAQDPNSTQRFPLADLAMLMTGDALLVEVTGEVPDPLEIDHADGISLPVLIRFAPGARATLIERADAEGFCNQSLYLDLGRDAHLTHATIATRADACHWSLTQVSQSARSRYVRQQYATGGQRRRTETQILLREPEASADVTGAYVVDGGTHLDQQLVVEHRARATESRQRFHGIGAGKGTAVFNGRIHIHPGAPGADAALSNRNLALHADAIINTKPELEIYTDDVKCSHGATVGRLSEESLFYLRSRGLDSQQARRMLCRAFIRECVTGPLAETAEAALLGAWLGPDA